MCNTRQLASWAALLGLGLAAQTAPLDPAEFPARDTHEGVTLAARPVPDTPEAEALFGENAAPTRAGFLPVELVIANEREEAVRVTLGHIVVVTDTEKFEQRQPEEISWALYPPPESKKPIDSSRIPKRLPKDKNRGKREEAEAALRSRQLRAAVVGPGSRARGYLYFDLRGATIDLRQARVYVPEVVALPGEEALFYFEISLKPYATAQP